MAGVKGQSGGARPGAGRKPKQPTVLQFSMTYDDPAKFLAAVMNDAETDVKVRTDAAKALMPYKHVKMGEGGKKELAQDKANKAASRFSSSAPPKLAAVGGKRL